MDTLADRSPLVTVMNGRFQVLSVGTGTPGGAELLGDPRAGVPLPVGFL
ncbi:MAG TPA: hypothetical protein VJT72_01640 [Pseudonocardiaceae bacterium]|nr:hypothetical protein [Pseudonocardiaceae bacterium]